MIQYVRGADARCSAPAAPRPQEALASEHFATAPLQPRDDGEDEEEGRSASPPAAAARQSAEEEEAPPAGRSLLGRDGRLAARLRLGQNRLSAGF